MLSHMLPLIDFYILHPFFLVGMVAILGLLVGSFLNVVIYRLPKMIELQCEGQSTEKFNLNRPASHCPRCQKPVLWWQNIPVISYIVLRGKCFYCHDKISVRYCAVELLTAILSGYLACHFGYGWPLMGALLFTWIVIACFFIDWDHQLLPDTLTLLLLWIGLLFNLNHCFTSLSSAVVGAMVGYLFFWIIFHLFKLLTAKEGLGYGDLKLLAAIGAWVGWLPLILVVLISAVVTLMAVILFACVRHQDLKKAVPYGPGLVVGGWVALLWGQPLIALYLTWAVHV